MIYFAETHPDDERLANIAARHAGEQQIDSLSREIRYSEALPRARRAAELRVEKALTLLAAFPPSPHRQALEEIAAFAIEAISSVLVTSAETPIASPPADLT